MPFKAAYITPLLKKPDLDPVDVKSFRELPTHIESVETARATRRSASSLFDSVQAVTRAAVYLQGAPIDRDGGTVLAFMVVSYGC